MPFRASFECLWCGRAWTTRGPDDLEGYAQLCPDCVGRAGDNGFLRFRLKAAIEERARMSVGAPAAAGEARPGVAAPSITPPTAGGGAAPAVAALADEAEAAPAGDLDAEMIAYYEARADEYDDWYLRRGRYAHGPVHDQAWNAELDSATLWLDGLPLSGEIVELAAGTGWWSPLLATKGDLSIYDAADGPLDRARDRLLAHGLRAHIHVRDAWLEPDRPVDAVFAGFWLSHVPRERLVGVPRARPALAQARRPVRVHRFPARPEFGCGRSARDVGTRGGRGHRAAPVGRRPCIPGRQDPLRRRGARGRPAGRRVRDDRA